MPQPTDQQYGTVAGMAAGGALGSFGGPMGAKAGMEAGGAIGEMIGGSFDKSPGGPSLQWDQYNQRLAEITDYQNQLTGAQSSWATAIGNYNTTMMNLATPYIEARYAAHGMGFNSGAVAAEVARQAAMYMAEGTTAIAKQNFNNINSVEDARGRAWSSMFDLAGKNNQLGWDANNTNETAALGSLGLAGSTAINAWAAKKSQTPSIGTTYGGGGALPGNMAYTGNMNPFSDPMGMRSETTPQFRLLGS